jgi:hypothetical protein
VKSQETQGTPYGAFDETVTAPPVCPSLPAELDADGLDVFEFPEFAEFELELRADGTPDVAGPISTSTPSAEIELSGLAVTPKSLAI